MPIFDPCPNVSYQSFSLLIGDLFPILYCLPILRCTTSRLCFHGIHFLFETKILLHTAPYSSMLFMAQHSMVRFKLAVPPILDISRVNLANFSYVLVITAPTCCPNFIFSSPSILQIFSVLLRHFHTLDLTTNMLSVYLYYYYCLCIFPQCKSHFMFLGPFRQVLLFCAPTTKLDHRRKEWWLHFWSVPTRASRCIKYFITSVQIWNPAGLSYWFLGCLCYLTLSFYRLGSLLRNS